MILSSLQRFWRWYLKRQDPDMALDCRFMGFSIFGSELWLIGIGRHVTISSGVSFITHDGGTWVSANSCGQEKRI
jgi:hypothetical protein